MQWQSCNKLKDIQLTLETKQRKEINQWNCRELQVEENPADVD